ncbi:TorD/DmsD family molecular chaperone [Desulfohalovibrio reitneri]|uniref:TorD/DmsD family molecular chaperone n=1 Tax=Desulfohalovibrio reitneri TaxID=1307759 RepID=UPI000689B85F|nr:molecular chaperone TorD family protein [Desulfohalovibrio reitneri]
MEYRCSESDITGVAARPLRDFFAAVTKDDMRAAFELLAADDPDAPRVSDWDEVEFAFNRFFVGPAKLQAAPYASVHLDPEASLMSESTLAARGVYDALGLAVPDRAMPDDHIAYELDGAIALRFAAQHVEPERSGDLADLRRQFITEHMGKWIPAFAQSVRQAGPPPAIEYVARRLEGWLEAEMDEADEAVTRG